MLTMARSYLFAPGDNERLLAKVWDAGADAVVLDLEDAVAEERKSAARELVTRTLRDCLTSRPGSRPDAWVRINDLAGLHWRDDLRALPAAALVGLRIPKAESVADLDRLDEELVQAEERADVDRGRVRLTCTIESAVGLLEARSLAEHPRVSHLAFGEADFVADIGAEVTEDGRSTLYARSQLVVAARAAGIAAPIAPVYTRLEDEDGLRRSTEAARVLGFFGRSAIHPRQLAAIHDVFTPDPEAVRRARDVVRAYEEAGGGAATTSGEFVDAAVVRRARRILELAELAEHAGEPLEVGS